MRAGKKKVPTQARGHFSSVKKVGEVPGGRPTSLGDLNKKQSGAPMKSLNPIITC